MLNIIAQLIHEISHRAEDKRIDKITTAVRFGENTKNILRAFVVLSGVLSLMLLEKMPFVSIPTLVFLTYFFWHSYGNIGKGLRKKYKILGAVCGIFYLINFL